MGTWTIQDTYVAADGERCLLSVTVDRHDDDYEAAKREATNYFAVYGIRVVESAKAAGMWPLPSDHPNAPQGP